MKKSNCRVSIIWVALILLGLPFWANGNYSSIKILPMEIFQIKNIVFGDLSKNVNDSKLEVVIIKKKLKKGESTFVVISGNAAQVPFRIKIENSNPEVIKLTGIPNNEIVINQKGAFHIQLEATAIKKGKFSLQVSAIIGK